MPWNGGTSEQVRSGPLKIQFVNVFCVIFLSLSEFVHVVTMKLNLHLIDILNFLDIVEKIQIYSEHLLKKLYLQLQRTNICCLIVLAL